MLEIKPDFKLDMRAEVMKTVKKLNEAVLEAVNRAPVEEVSAPGDDAHLQG